MDWQLKWKLIRVLALGVVATVLSANSQVSKVEACSGCSMFCFGNTGACMPVCTDQGTAAACTIYNGTCVAFGNCTGDGGGGVGGEGC